MKRATKNGMEFSISLPYDRIRITGVTELHNADPTVANTVKAPNLISPKGYEVEDKIYGGKLTVTTKPISVVKIDFVIEK